MEEIIVFFFFFDICIFIKKSREKATYFDIICRFFSLKRGDCERGRAVVNSSSPFFLDLFRQKKKNSIAKDEKKKKLRNIRRFFLILLTYFHLAFDELFFFMKNEIKTIYGCPMYRRPYKSILETLVISDCRICRT